MAGLIEEINDENFDEHVLQSELPVLVDFWAEWCGPCKMMAPVLEELAQEYSGKVKFCKINTDKNQTTAAANTITAIPTLLVFKGGKEVARRVGVDSKAELKTAIDECVS